MLCQSQDKSQDLRRGCDPVGGGMIRRLPGRRRSQVQERSGDPVAVFLL
jgi:hypothetical protein